MTINGLQVERRQLAELVRAPWNPRKIGDDQARALQRSLAEFGTVEPIIINSVTGNVVGGHQRLDALLANGGTETDVLVGKWSPEQEKALNIALNKIHGEWDEDKLSALLTELQDADFDVGLTGFNDAEIDDLFSVGGEAQGRTLDPEQEQHLNAAWQSWARESLKFLEVLQPMGIVTPTATPVIATIYFLRALYLGERYPRWCSHAFHPHQVHVAGQEYSMIWALEKAVDDPAMAARLRWALKETPNFDIVLKQSPPVHSARLAPDFPAKLARDYINEFCPVGGAVLDPCHGWGGRLVGFLLSHADRYAGFDPCEETATGVRAVFSTFSPFVPTKRTMLVRDCFEDVELSHNFYDFAITSPPYYDVEKYTGDQSSHVRYGSLEEWDEKFFAVLINKVSRALKAGSHFCLQIGNQTYPLERMAKEHATQSGFEFVETRPTGMRNTLQETAEADGEVMVIFRKPS